MFCGFKADGVLVGAGFLTGGSLAIRGGFKAARNSAIGCAILLAVIEGVGIGIQRMMAENTRLDVRISHLAIFLLQGLRADRRNSYQLLHRLSVQRWTQKVRWSPDELSVFFDSKFTPLCHIWQILRYLALAGIHALCLRDDRYMGIVLYARYSLRIAERRTAYRMRRYVRLSIHSRCLTNHLMGLRELIETKCMAHLAAPTSLCPPHPTR